MGFFSQGAAGWPGQKAPLRHTGSLLRGGVSGPGSLNLLHRVVVKTRWRGGECGQPFSVPIEKSGVEMKAIQLNDPQLCRGVCVSPKAGKLGILHDRPSPRGISWSIGPGKPDRGPQLVSPCPLTLATRHWQGPEGRAPLPSPMAIGWGGGRKEDISPSHPGVVAVALEGCLEVDMDQRRAGQWQHYLDKATVTFGGLMEPPPARYAPPPLGSGARAWLAELDGASRKQPR